MNKRFEIKHRKNQVAAVDNRFVPKLMAIITEMTGLEHLNCIKVGEVPKLIAIQLVARVIKIFNKRTKMKYKIKYYYWKIMHLIGICPRCFTLVNYTQHGKAICPRGCKY